MANTIIMSKYQGLGNDYLILDPKKNQVQLQGKKIALLCQRGFGRERRLHFSAREDLGLALTVCSMDR